MVYVGIDLHRKRSHVAVIEEDGSQRLSRRLVNDSEVFRELFDELGEDATFALEATYGWEWLAELPKTRAASCTSRIRCGPRRSPRRA